MNAELRQQIRFCTSRDGVTLAFATLRPQITAKAKAAKRGQVELARAGSDPLGNTPREAAEFLEIEIARWGRVIKQAGVKIE